VANNYLEFSETLGPLTKKEAAWLQQQLDPIVVVNGTEFPADDAPEYDEPDYRGLQFLRDHEDLDDDADMPGFGVEFQSAGKDRQAWFHAEEGGDPGRVAHLVQKFLKKFRPDQCWSLTYATTCSKPRLGEFGGGAVFVMADSICWNSSYDFVEEQRMAFARGLQYDRRLIGKAAEMGIEPEQLDEAVHEAASAAATSINNAGLGDQIVYLIEHCGAEETEKILNELSGTGQEHDNE